MQKVLIVGASVMGHEYAKILKDQSINFHVVCRSEESAQKINEWRADSCSSGGLANFSIRENEITHAIVAVGVEALATSCKVLIEQGVKYILVEKPAGLNSLEIRELNSFAEAHKAIIAVAYNRRFYASVLRAQEIIEEDGGVLSGNFEFTEWSHKIEPLEKAPGVKENWFLANSTHVVDMAFHLLGKPVEMKSFSSGKNTWHTPIIFSGSGVSTSGALFSYRANWISAGRWGVEVLTKKRKLILCPLEQLQEQLVGTIKVEPVTIDDTFDNKFKPGLWMQTKTFIQGDFERLKLLKEQVEDLEHFESILGK